ncbi:Ser-Thr-rich glycosyl-phosphatidyl-inositol-anchored membrane family-domain-containing protein [Lactarius deliciosus]|nr:Ser-Thr-rich glycosyl-phosphatidyl-inositol-anchored membrane family-domain-containing protein [Lactarius deliciosus]
MQFFFTLLSFVALASAYQVTSPGGSSGWTIAGPNVVTWQRVSTDPLNFTIVLSNQARTPSYQQVLAALIDGNLGKFTVSPPSTGFPTGTGFQVNLVKDSENLSTIYAQSQQFAIVQATTTTSSSLTATTPFTTRVATNTDTNTDLNPTGSLTNTTAPSNGADRITAAGSAGLVFGVLAAMVL